MTTEEGIVVGLSGPSAKVKTQKTGACESCSAKGSCHTLGGGKEMEVEAANLVDAQIGDRVMMGFETASLIKASFLIYVFPILCMIGGGLVGQEIALGMGISPGASSIIFAFLFLGLSLVFVRIKGNQMAQKKTYHPKIIRILGKA